MAAFISEERKQLLLRSRDSTPFIVPGAVSVGSGEAKTVCTITIPEGYTGVITALGFQAMTATDFPDITWTVLANDLAVRGLSAMVFQVSTLNTPYEVHFEAGRGKVISIQAKNTALSSIDVAAVLIGYQEPVLMGPKGYGGRGMTPLG